MTKRRITPEEIMQAFGAKPITEDSHPRMLMMRDIGEGRGSMRYIVAKLHKPRFFHSRTALELVQDRPDIEIKGSDNPNRLVVEATPEAIERLLFSFGDALKIEETIPFKPLST